MTTPPPTTDPEIEAIWRETLEHGHPGRWKFLPADPRCAMCSQPLAGFGGAMLRWFKGIRPASMTPNMCSY